jgi:hypothetical protein
LAVTMAASMAAVTLTGFMTVITAV